MVTRHQIIRLQKVIIELQHRLMNRETIECATFVCQRIDALRVEAFKGIASAFGCRAGGLFGFKTVELFECVRNLLGCVDGGKNHVAMFEDVVDEGLDGGIFRTGEEGSSITKLNAVVNCGRERNFEICSRGLYMSAMCGKLEVPEVPFSLLFCYVEPVICTMEEVRREETEWHQTNRHLVFYHRNEPG